MNSHETLASAIINSWPVFIHTPFFSYIMLKQVVDNILVYHKNFHKCLKT